MPVGECLRKVTNREYRTWMEWFGEELNKPDRHDYYIMRLTAVMLHRAPKSLEALKIKFSSARDKSKTFTVDQATQWAKARWLAWTGFFNFKKNREKYKHLQEQPIPQVEEKVPIRGK